MWSATATSGLPSVSKSPMTVDQPKGLAAFPSLKTAASGAGASISEAPETEETRDRPAWDLGCAWELTDASTTSATHIHAQNGRRKKRIAYTNYVQNK